MAFTLFMRLILLILLFTVPIYAFSRPDLLNEDSAKGYKIVVTVTPFKNQEITLGHYYGKNVVWVQSATLNENSEAVFSDSVKLKGGIYVILVNDESMSFNLLIDKQQHFSVTVVADSNGVRLPVFNQSAENIQFYQHQSFVEGQGKKMQLLLTEIRSLKSYKDSTPYLNRFNDIQKESLHYEDSVIQLNPLSFFSVMTLASRQPTIPGTYTLPRDYHDATIRTYAKAHFWDHVLFSDGRLVYTPFFEEKLNKYFNDVLTEKSDTVINVIKDMLLYARADSVMYSYLLPKFLYASLNHTYGWDDAVFIYLFQNYIANNTYDWLDEEQKKQMAQKAYYLMGHMIGSLSPKIELPDLSGVQRSSHAITSNYLVVCFWDPTCHHCVETLPRLDSMYRAKWKAAGINVMTVAVESGSTLDDWKQYLHGKKLEAWTNLYYSMRTDSIRITSGKKGYTEEYDVWYYPSFFLLDKNKRFMAKKFTYEQLVDFITTNRIDKLPVKKEKIRVSAKK